MRLAFQQVGAKLLLQPGTAPVAFRLLLSWLVLWLSGHQRCTLLQQSLYHAYILGGAPGEAGFALHGHPRYGRVAPLKSEAERAAACETSPGSQSRRSSVVEHVIGNDGVGSSILPDGTILNQGLKSVSPPLKVVVLTPR